MPEKLKNRSFVALMIAIVVPCHRIIGRDHSLTGYAGGLWRKKALLELESNQGTLF